MSIIFICKLLSSHFYKQFLHIILYQLGYNFIHHRYSENLHYYLYNIHYL